MTEKYHFRMATSSSRRWIRKTRMYRDEIIKQRIQTWICILKGAYINKKCDFGLFFHFFLLFYWMLRMSRIFQKRNRRSVAASHKFQKSTFYFYKNLKRFFIKQFFRICVYDIPPPKKKAFGTKKKFEIILGKNQRIRDKCR